MRSIRAAVASLLPADRSARGIAVAAGRGVLSAWLLAAGLAFALTALATIVTFAWPQPTYDQFRLYPIYLEQPFPQNVLQRENQHRPIVPGLVRVAEIRWFGANQWLQISFGLACAFATAGLIALVALRAKELRWPARAAGFAAAWMAVFWFGNVRMLLHGNELVHAYLLTLSVVLGALAVWRAMQAAPLRWMALATLAGTVATFCFGPGIAAFPAFALAAWCGRVPLRACLLPLAGALVCLVLYVFVLPGGADVRHGIALRPLDAIAMTTRLLASPWVNAWLGFGDPPYNAVHAGILAGGDDAWLVTSANAVLHATGLRWETSAAVIIGSAGVLVLLAWLVNAARTRIVHSPLELLGAVLMLFGAASMGTLALGRLDYLHQFPEQVFADRYLVWPCLFWLGAVLLLLTRRARAGAVLKPMAIAAAMLLPLLLWPTHKLGAGWGASVYRGNQAMAAAARADVIDPDVFWREDPSADWTAKLRSLALFRERHLAMFATPGADALGQAWTGSLRADSAIRIDQSAPVPAQDVRPGHAPARFYGVITQGHGPQGDELLVVLDAQDRIAGYGQISFHGKPAPTLRRRLHEKFGFDAFVHRYDPAQTYRLAALDFVRGEGRVLQPLRPMQPAP